jgi:hypothetical protein
MKPLVTLSNSMMMRSAMVVDHGYGALGSR